MTRNRATQRAAPSAAARCAVYTRKSSEDGLEQHFNSLDVQREACLAYTASQRHEGWTALPTLYEDGGFSGGTLSRPALQRLLADIGAGRLDLVRGRNRAAHLPLLSRPRLGAAAAATAQRGGA